MLLLGIGIYLGVGFLVGLISRTSREREAVAVFLFEVVAFVPEILVGIYLGFRDEGGFFKSLVKMYRHWQFRRHN